MIDETFLQAAKRLIAARSTFGNAAGLAEAVEQIEARLKEQPGITVERFDSAGTPSLLAYAGSKRPEVFKVLLNGHVDVVPARDDQFAVKVDGERLYGRGALDMKVAALALTEVFCAVAGHVDYPLGLQIVADEEMGGKHGTGHQIEEGVRAEFVLAGEFTNLDINVASKGVCWVKATAKGVAAHSAYLWEGRNAVSDLQQFSQRLLETYPVPKEEVWQTTANIASLSTPNTAMNRVPDVAEALIDIRYVPEDPNFASRQQAQQFLSSLQPGVSVELLEFENCHTSSPDDPFVRQLEASVKEVTGKAPRLYKKNGASDVRYYSELGNPAVTFGLEGEGLHGDDEYVVLPSVARYREVVKNFLERLSASE